MSWSMSHVVAAMPSSKRHDLVKSTRGSPAMHVSINNFRNDPMFRKIESVRSKFQTFEAILIADKEHPTLKFTAPGLILHRDPKAKNQPIAFLISPLSSKHRAQTGQSRGGHLPRNPERYKPHCHLAGFDIVNGCKPYGHNRNGPD